MTIHENNLLLPPSQPGLVRLAANPQPLKNVARHSCAECPDERSNTMNGEEAVSLWDAAGRRKYLNAQERERFVEAAATFNPDIEALCLLLHYTGCRVSEALALRRHHLDVGDSAVVFQTLKQRKARRFRMLPLPQEFIERLTSSDAPQDSNLFAWHRSTAWEKVCAVMDMAGVVGPQRCPRGIRHGFGVAAVSRGIPLTLVQRWLGHARIETTAIYLAVVGPEERSFAERMWV